MTLIRNTLVCVSTLLAAHLVAAEEVVSVYVSLDREHSEKVIAHFEKETGIQVEATYDTEANKTVGLMRKLIA